MSCFGSNCRSHVREWHYEDLNENEKKEYMGLLKNYQRQKDERQTNKSFYEFLKDVDKSAQERHDEHYIGMMKNYNDAANRYVVDPNPSRSPVKPRRIISNYIRYADLNVQDGTPVTGGTTRGRKLHNHRRSHKRVRSKKSKKSRKYK